MSIGLFGGSFNPPHVCHTLATLWALQTRELDEVWWIPTYDHAFDKDLVDFGHRRDMCRLAISDLDNVSVSEIEADLGGESRTVDTVRELTRRHPEETFALIVGADILDETDDWKAWDELMEMVRLVVIGRERYGEREDDQSPPITLPDVSSTKTREALRNRDREWLETWIPREVLAYVDDHELYL